MASEEPLFSAGEELRIVLFGRARVKNSARNIILGGTKFETTEKCKVETAFIEGQKVTVVDTPVLFLSDTNEEDVLKEFKKSISLAAPGPHVFLIVLDVRDKFTQELQKMVKLIRSTFGKNTMAYTMVLFSYENKLGIPIEDYFCTNKDLHNVIIQCHWKYHVFDITDKAPNPDQVKSLLNKINGMIERRGKDGSYTPEMLQQAEKEAEKEAKQKA
ncbi:GTPase IMAP family member 5-like [Micropterus salmoides]|uniref:GTPase IMAP family member 5-like n=1 Tax=Micropterus salmoides TaxID=27706 RepID=UPI0018EC5454|nr:GTPase IMAP family member 5-like [Micropterus salmoides]